MNFKFGSKVSKEEVEKDVRFGNVYVIPKDRLTFSDMTNESVYVDIRGLDMKDIDGLEVRFDNLPIPEEKPATTETVSLLRGVRGSLDNILVILDRASVKLNKVDK